MRYSLLLFLLYLLAIDFSLAQAPLDTAITAKQTDLIEIIIKALKINVKEKPLGKNRVSFSFIPVSTTSSGGNRVFVSSINAAFILGHQDSTNISSVYVLPYTDFYHNIGVGTKINLWTSNNIWNVPGEFRISSLTQYTYGLGSSTETKDRFRLTYNTVRMYLYGNRKLVDFIYAGLGFNYDRFYNVVEENAPTTPSDFKKYAIGTGPTVNSTGITVNMLYDNRKNSINPDNGFYSTVIFRVNPSFLADNYQWTSLYLDSRKYFSLDPHKRKILAIWGMYWGSYGNVPYFNLPATQMELGFRSGRGYAPARFRGKQMLYFESEYRFDITANGLLGAVLFANAQSFTEVTNNQFQYINPAAGFGARIKFNKESNTNLTLDFGFGKNSFNVYFALGEFF